MRIQLAVSMALLVSWWAASAPLSAAPDSAIYLDDHLDLIAYSRQGWGALGVNACAHAPGQAGLPLRIGAQQYARGLGHHANGELLIDLDGQYATFAAAVGVQPGLGAPGSAVFKVYVDGRLEFESGVMKGNESAKAITIAVAGAGELRLEVTDAGDGITCDCANWADARLVPSAAPQTIKPQRLDAAAFARVVTSDPTRLKGCLAGRTEEYRREDVYLESDLASDSSSHYAVPFAPDGAGAIGLRWLERRVLMEVGLEFAEAGAPRSTDGVQLQYWAGESAWQGEWKPLPTTIQVDGNTWRVRLRGQQAPELNLGTRRIRWVFPPAAKGVLVKRLTATSPAALVESTVQIECDPKALGDSAATMAPAEITLYNGELINPVGRGAPPTVRWNYRSGEPLTLTVRHTRPRPANPERTLLRFQLPAGGAFGVAIDDVLTQGQVFVKSSGIYVTHSPATTNLDEYRRQIAGRRTILEEVRHLPDQTFAQAIAHVHNPRQNLQPTMLSLACDNHKFIAHRTGVIEFPVDQANPGTVDNWMATSRWIADDALAVLVPKFGNGSNANLHHALDGGWLPMPVVQVDDTGITYRQRTFVVPLEDAPLPAPGWFSPHPLGVAEYTLQNPGAQTAAATLSLTMQAKRPLSVQLAEPGRVLIADGERLLACVDLAESKLKCEIRGNEILLTGDLPAGAAAHLGAYLPGWVMAAKDQHQLSGSPELGARCRAYWERVMAPAAKISVPDPLLMNVIKASQVHCLLAARNEADGQRVAPWIAATYYGPLESEANSIIRGMDYFGHHEFARRGHDFFIHRYNPAGFLTTGYTLMGTGWQLWTLGEHYQLTHDTAWLKQVAPEVARVCQWILAQREKTRQLGPDGRKAPEYGLMPPGVMADWNAYAYHFCLNGYYYAALVSAGGALADIGYPDAKTWPTKAEEFRADILRAYRWTQAHMPAYLLRDGTAIPGCPSQVHSPGPVGDFFAGEDANRSWCYDVELGAHQLVPTGVLDSDDPEVLHMMDYYEDVQFLADGWFDYSSARNHADWYNLGGFAKVQPYYCRNCEIYALRDDVKPFIRSYFNTIPTLLSLENLCFQEHFNYAGAWNKTHETGYFLHQSRLMMVREKDQELWLAPFVTSNWMHDGEQVAIENAPTRFGPVSYVITSHVADGRIEATIEAPTRQPPEVIVLRLRHPDGRQMHTVTVNGAEHRNFSPGREIIRFAPGPGTNRVVATY